MTRLERDVRRLIVAGGVRPPSWLAALWLVPSDLAGRILAIGYLGLALLGVAGLLAGNPIAALYVVGAVVGYALIGGRLVGLVIWLLVAAVGLVGAVLGDRADWLQAGLGSVLAATAGYRMVAPQLSLGLPVIPGSAPAQHPEPAQSPAPVPAVDNPDAPRVTIRTVGRFAVSLDGVDVTGELLDRPLVGFVWTYLLARALLHAQDRMLRTALADEVFPGLPMREQKRKLRSLLYDIQHDLPQALGSRVLVDNQRVGFQLDGLGIDADRLGQLVDSLAADPELLDDSRLERLGQMVDGLGNGDFLPHFEEPEERVTGGRGSAGDTIREVRAQVGHLRERLLTVLADNYLARRQPERCVQLLEPVVKDGSAGEELTQRLIDAYLRNRQPALASRLSRQLDGGQKEELR